MTEVKFLIVCKACNAAVDPEVVIEHMNKVHGISTEFLLNTNINQSYAVMAIIDKWPEQTKRRKLRE